MVIKIASIQTYKISDFNFSLFVSWMLFVYALSYRPFITESYLPVPFRIGIEGFVLFLLAIVSLRYQYLIKIVWFVSALLIFDCALLFEMDTFIRLISSFNKLAFLILVLSMFNGNQRVLNACINIWIRFSYFLSIAALLAFISYATGLIAFPPMDLGESVSGVQGSYYYLHNDILGNLSPKKIFGIDTGRVAGYMYEGGLLGVILGLNILAARDWIEDAQKRKRFVLLNFIAGLTTFSTTFILFFGAYFLTKNTLFGKNLDVRSKAKSFILLGSMLIIFLLLSDYLGKTSGGDRLERMRMYFSIVENNTWSTLLLGNGVGIALNKFNIGIDAGWVAILVERGILMLVFIVVLYTMLSKHNYWIMFYILCVNCAFNMFWDPLFLLVVAMSYANFNNKRRTVVRACLSGLQAFKSASVMQWDLPLSPAPSGLPVAIQATSQDIM